MGNAQTKVKGLGLCSGGLDSILAALVLRQQGIHVEWITFVTPFFSANNAKAAARHHDIPITVKNIFPVYFEMLKAPPAGYGKNMNPCMDCHSMMFRLAGEEMTRRGFDFLFSGEVLGQRPMSQSRPSLRYVEKHAGWDGRILRPLSARLLEETAAEQDGRVDRSRLLDFSGRSRKPQMALAKTLGVTDYPSPAGGCLLTDSGYSKRLKDLFAHQEDITEQELELLKYGRHLRLDPITKIVVGRNHKENEKIREYFDPSVDIAINVSHHPGPLTVIPNKGNPAMHEWAAGICAGYSKAPKSEPAEVILETPEGERTLVVKCIPPLENADYLL
jgi:tRNA U34 2-thiouridine synthase MnmA/TrmU